MKLSVVLLTWNSEKYIHSCLDALLSAIEAYDYELFIVDNGSVDRTLSLLRTYTSDKRVELLQNRRNRGVSKARNQALRRVSGDVVTILDIDTIVNKNAIAAMVNYLQEEPATGVVACKLVSPEGTVQLSCRRYPSFFYKLSNILEGTGIEIKRNQSQFYQSEMNGEAPFEVDYVIGACQFIRKEAMAKVGLLDEHIFYGPEDADFCLRMKHKGWKVVYLPSVSIIHHYQQVSKKKLFSRLSFLHIIALFYFFTKHAFSKK